MEALGLPLGIHFQQVTALETLLAGQERAGLQAPGWSTPAAGYQVNLIGPAWVEGDGLFPGAV